MKLGILSDTHNNESGTLAVIDVLKAEGVTELIHCGDMTGFGITSLFKDFVIHHVQGNNDFDLFSIEIALSECQPGSSTGIVYTGIYDGKHVAALHGHNANKFYTLLESGKFDYIFHGHTHRRGVDQTERTTVINPGAIGGRHPEKRSFCILDTQTGELVYYDME